MTFKQLTVSIKFKIGVLVGLTAAIVMSVLASVSYFSTLKGIKSQYIANIESKASETSVKAGEYYKNGFQFNQYLVAQIQAAFDPIYPMALTIDEVFPVVRNYMRSNENILSVNLVLEEGIISYSDTTTQIRDYFDSFGRFAVHFWRDPAGKIRYEKLLNLDTEPNGDFYIQPRKFKKEIITTPELLNFHGVEQLVFWQSTPILINNEFKGVVAVVMNNEPVTQMFDNKNINIESHWLLTTEKGVIVFDSEQDFFVGQQLKQVYKESLDLMVDIQSGTMNSRISDGKIIIGQPVWLNNQRHSFYILSTTPNSELADETISLRFKMLSISFIMLLLGGGVIIYYLNVLIKPLDKVAKVAEDISLGKIYMNKLPEQNDEIGKVSKSLNKIIDSLSKMAEFANQIRQGKLNSEYETLSKDDSLGNALLSMRQSLIEAENNEHIRREEDFRRNWSTEGLARFANFLRQNNDNLEEFAYTVISELTEYLGAVQSALFIVTEADEHKKYLELVSAYAFSKRKYLKRNIEFGNELVGTCAVEKNTIIINHVPDNYVYITSGLGETKPRQIILVPLIYKDELYGVLEVASLHHLEPYKIQFTEILAENIAGTISSVKIADQTNKLLIKTRQQSEDMLVQEDEMRINLEELQATQERFAHRDSEIKSLLAAVDKICLVAEYDLGGILTSANDLFASFFERTKESMYGKSASFLNQIQAKHEAEFAAFWQKIVDGEVIEDKWEVKIGNRTKSFKAIFAPLINADGLPFKIVSIGYEIVDEG